MCGKFEKHYGRSDFESALEDAFGILEFSRENYDSTDGRNALSNFYVARAYEAMGNPENAKPYIKKSQALLVPNRKPVEIWVTPGFADVFTPLPEYEQSVHLLSPDIELDLEQELEL